jgi:hypothetical protein
VLGIDIGAGAPGRNKMRSSSTRRGAGAAVLATLLMLTYTSGMAPAFAGNGK